MAMKWLVVIALALLVGCTNVPEIKTSTQKVVVQVLYVPEPPVVKRPELPIDQMTDDQLNSDGKIALYAEATIIALRRYATELEMIIEDYRKKSKEAQTIREQVEQTIENNEATQTP